MDMAIRLEGFEFPERGKAGVKLRDNPNLIASCDVLVGMLETASLQYSCLSPAQKHFLETIIGAALYYLPTSTELWTGKVSVGLLKVFHPDSGNPKPKHTKDHEYPRKIAAAELLSRVRWHEVTDKTTHLITEYLVRYGRYHYITTGENHTLKWLQRKHLFTTPQDGYNKAEIVLIAVSRPEWLKISRRDRIVIDRCLDRA
jgi:hypothetical protein